MNGRTNYYEVAAVDGCGASANSSAASVFLPPPGLELKVSGTMLTISWPEWAGDWGLYSSTNLTAPVIWSVVTNEADNIDGIFTVNVPVSIGKQFFRLVAP